eukprot:scaffold340278_cov42-Attheya_sp.AAC.1
MPHRLLSLFSNRHRPSSRAIDMNMNASTANVLDKNKNTTTMIRGGAPNPRAKLSRLPLLVAALAALLLLP